MTYQSNPHATDIVRGRTHVASPLKYNTDPTGVRNAPGVTLPFSVFDVPRIMGLLKQGLIEGLPPMQHPTDDMLIATVIDNGMPKWSADQMRHHPGLRLTYYMFWLDVREAARGNSEAQGRVDGAREAWIQARKGELISEIPNHTVGLWER